VVLWGRVGWCFRGWIGGLRSFGGRARYGVHEATRQTYSRSNLDPSFGFLTYGGQLADHDLRDRSEGPVQYRGTAVMMRKDAWDHQRYAIEPVLRLVAEFDSIGGYEESGPF